jgi:chorismate mutase
MSFGGSVSAMISSIKANQNLRQKRTFFDKNQHDAILNKKRKALEFKSLNPETREKLNRRIARLNREKKIKYYKVYGLTGLITVLFFALIYSILMYAFF